MTAHVTTVHEGTRAPHSYEEPRPVPTFHWTCTCGKVGGQRNARGAANIGASHHKRLALKAEGWTGQ